MAKTKCVTSLEDMFCDLERCPNLYRPSKFWIHLNRQHRDQLSTSGLKNFKRSVNRRYFNWGLMGIIAHGLTPLIYSLLHGNFSSIRKGEFESYNCIQENSRLQLGDGSSAEMSLSFKQNPTLLARRGRYNKNVGKGLEHFNSLTAYFYKVYVCSLFDYVSLTDKFGVLKKLNEPKVGNPFIIKYKGRSISQDLCNSVHEFNSIFGSIDTSKTKDILEIGAGYGRLAFIFLKILPEVTYTIVDIPPALYVAEWYFTKVFAKEKIFRYRRFKSYKQIKNEFELSRIRFLMADQIEFLPKKSIDLMLNISSFHEMRLNQIKNYISEVNRICSGYFYTKQWHKSRTKDNFFIRQQDYPIPSNWKPIYSRYPHPIQKWFFDALYKIN